jgi:autotransporter translocation and assembly factor TamB
MASKKKIFKWISITIVTFLVMFFSIISSTIWFINSSQGQDWLLGQMNTLIAGHISVYDLHLSPLKGSLELTKVTLKDPYGMVVTGFEKLLFRVHWLSLLRKEVRITDLHLQKPWGQFYIDTDGHFNLLKAVASTSKKEEQPEEEPKPSTGLPIDLVVDNLTIENGDISFDNPSKAFSAHATGMSLWAEGNLSAQKAHFAVELDNLDLKAAETHIPSTRITIAADWDKSQINLSDLNVYTGESNIVLSGFIADIYNLSGLNIDVHSQVSITELARILKLDGTWSGNTIISADVTGEVQNPNANLNVNLEKGVVFNRSLDLVAFAASLSDRQLNIERTLVKLGGGKLNLISQVDFKSAFANGFLKPPVDMDLIGFTAKLNHAAPDIGPWVPEIDGLGGSLESHLILSGRGASIKGTNTHLNLTIKGSGLTAKGVHRPLNGQFNLKAELNEQDIRLRQLEGEIDGIQISGSGHYGLKKQDVTAALKLDAEDLSQPLKILGLTDAKGTLDLSFDLKGTLEQPQFDLTVNSKDLGYGDVTVGTVEMAADLDPDHTFQISSIKLVNQGSTINGRAKVRFLESWKGIDPTYHQLLDLELNEIEAHDFFHKEIIEGKLDGKLNLSGLLKDLKGTITLDSQDLTTEEVRLGNLHTQIRLDGNLLLIDELMLKNRNSEVIGKGKILLLDETFGKLVEDPEFQLTLTSKKIFLEDFVDKIKGRFTLDTDLNGSLKHPIGFLKLHGEKFDIGAQEIKTINLSAQIKDDQVTLAPFKIALSTDEILSLKGWAKMNQTFAFELNSTKINLSSIDSLKDIAGFKGGVQTYISIYGSLSDPQVDGSLIVEDLQINDQSVDDIRLHLSVHKKLARVYGDLNFDLDSSYHLLKKDLCVRIDFDQTKLGPYLKIAGQPDMDGEISGQLKVKGNVQKPADMVAHLNLTDLSVFFKKIPLFKTQKIKGRMAARRIFFEDTMINLLSTGKLSIGGIAHLNGPVDFGLDINLPIVDAGGFSEALVDAKGEVNLSTKITGSLPRPNIYADLNLVDIAVTVPETGQRIEKFTGKIRMNPKKIVVEDLEGMLDSGNFALSGAIEHDYYTPRKMNLSFNADALPVEIPDTLSLLLNSQIEVVGEEGKAKANGEIVLVSGSYYRDVNINLMLLESIGKRSRSVTPAAEPLELPFFKEIALNIDVKSREPFLVQNNLADMKIQPDLSIGGALSQPVVSGRADVTSGEITFKNNIFTVNKGVIDFINPYKTEMSIDIESQADIRNWTIFLTLKGTPNNLELKLTSVPSETDADILSLLIFGKTSKEFSNGETQNNTSARELLTGILADTLGEEVKESTGLDIFEVETGDEKDETGEKRGVGETEEEHENIGNGGDSKDDEDVSSDRVTVTMGKNLTDRMTVKVAVESEQGEMIQRAISEYKFLEHILISGYRDTKGVYGGKLIFRIEFR